MTLKDGIINPAENDKKDMFIGWAPAPGVDRRFLLGLLPFGLVGGAGLSGYIANELDDPGAGAWLTDATHKVTGTLITHPYPMLRVVDAASPFGLRTVLIVAEGKCTSSLRLNDVADTVVTASGNLIQRKNRSMLEVPLFLDKWIEKSTTQSRPAVATPSEESLGPVSLSGTIMDSKCFFGVMRPGRGKTHKACAALCIRGGIPPSFWARTKDGRESVLLMTDANGGPLSEEILPLVADHVSVTGNLVRVGDILQLRADPADYSRI